MASFEETLPQPVEDFMLIGSFGEVIVTPQSDIPEKDRPSQLFMHYFAQMPTRKKKLQKETDSRLQAEHQCCYRKSLLTLFMASAALH